MQLGPTIIKDPDNQLEFVFQYDADRDRFNVTRREVTERPNRTHPIVENGWVKERFAGSQDDDLNLARSLVEKTKIPQRTIVAIISMTREALESGLLKPKVHHMDASMEAL